MPVIPDIPFSLKRAEILRRQGLRKGARVRPEIRLLLRQLLASLKRTRLTEPAAASYYTVSGMSDS
jgi:hypothetical protein